MCANSFIDMAETNTSYFRYYQDIFLNNSSCHLFDAIPTSHVDDRISASTSDEIVDRDEGQNSFDMQIKFARLIVYGAQEFMVNKQMYENDEEGDEPSSFLSDTTLSFLQIVFFITVICLVRQYFNLRVVREEPIRLINKAGDYDAYDLVPDTPLNRKSSQKHTRTDKNDVHQKSGQLQLQINSKINRQKNHHLIQNDVFTERETILLLNKLNAAANNNAPKKKYNTDKFVTNKRKCTSVGPVMNTSCNDDIPPTLLPVKDEKFAAMLERNIQHDENTITCTCEANWRQAVLMHHQNEAAIYNDMCV